MCHAPGRTRTCDLRIRRTAKHARQCSYPLDSWVRSAEAQTSWSATPPPPAAPSLSRTTRRPPPNDGGGCLYFWRTGGADGMLDAQAQGRSLLHHLAMPVSGYSQRTVRRGRLRWQAAGRRRGHLEDHRVLEERGVRLLTRSEKLQTEPIVHLDHEDVGAVCPEGAAEILERRKFARTRIIRSRHVPDEKEGTAA